MANTNTLKLVTVGGESGDRCKLLQRFTTQETTKNMGCYFDRSVVDVKLEVGQRRIVDVELSLWDTSETWEMDSFKSMLIGDTDVVVICCQNESPLDEAMKTAQEVRARSRDIPIVLLAFTKNDIRELNVAGIQAAAQIKSSYLQCYLSSLESINHVMKTAAIAGFVHQQKNQKGRRGKIRNRVSSALKSASRRLFHSRAPQVQPNHGAAKTNNADLFPGFPLVNDHFYPADATDGHETPISENVQRDCDDNVNGDENSAADKTNNHDDDDDDDEEEDDEIDYIECEAIDALLAQNKKNTNPQKEQKGQQKELSVAKRALPDIRNMVEVYDSLSRLMSVHVRSGGYNSDTMPKRKFVYSHKGIGDLELLMTTNRENIDGRFEMPDSTLAVFQSLSSLDISQNWLRTLPDCLGDLHLLTSLNVDRNKLTTLPEAIGKLSNLSELYLAHNAITQLPASFTKLTKLQVLSLEDNVLETLPDDFHNLVALDSVELQANRLKSLPKSFSQMASLTWCCLYGNDFGDGGNNCLPPLPPSLVTMIAQASKLKSFEITSVMDNLAHLYLTMNEMTELPESIGMCKNLIELKVNNNKLTTLPDSLGKLHKLEILDAQSNNITTLPESIGRLQALRHLVLRKNPIATSFDNLPLSVGRLIRLEFLSFNTEIEGPTAVQNCFNQWRWSALHHFRQTERVKDWLITFMLCVQRMDMSSNIPLEVIELVLGRVRGVDLMKGRKSLQVSVDASGVAWGVYAEDNSKRDSRPWVYTSRPRRSDNTMSVTDNVNGMPYAYDSRGDHRSAWG